MTNSTTSNEFQIFDPKGNVRQFTDEELSALPPDRRQRLDAVIVAAKDVANCEAMIGATQRSLKECDEVLTAVKANMPKVSSVDAARDWIASQNEM
jgi:hypothetical protein